MKVITFASQKGGSGKSTLAFQALVQAGEHARAIDLDPQESLASLARIRGSGNVVTGSTATLAAQITKARADGVKWLILDVAPHASVAMTTVISVSDLVVIPAIPSILDLLALEGITNIVKSANKRAILVLNKCTARAAETQNALDFIREKHPAIPIGAVIFGRIAYPRACGYGQGVAEYEPTGPAALEVRQMWAAIEEFCDGD